VEQGYIDPTVVPAFLAAAAVLCLAPGPDMIYMVATGIAAGRPAAVRAAMGVAVGVLVYVVAVAAGLGLVVERAPVTLTVLQGFGVAYLAWLGFSTLRDASSSDTFLTDRTDRNWFRRGVIVNLTNPKVLLFFVAFLPQFLGDASSPALQLLMLGLLFQLVGLLVDLGLGWASGSLRDKVLTRHHVRRTMALTSAAVYGALAAVVAIELIRASSH
jgi:threonine/homoserine/homoserine lactone efflux protein